MTIQPKKVFLLVSNLDGTDYKFNVEAESEEDAKKKLTDHLNAIIDELKQR